MQLAKLGSVLVLMDSVEGMSWRGISIGQSRGTGMYRTVVFEFVFLKLRSICYATIHFISGSDIARSRYVRNCSNIDTENVGAHGFSAKAVSVGGGENVTLRRWNIAECGAGGALLDGGDRPTLTPCNHRVRACVLHIYRIRLTGGYYSDEAVCAKAS